MDPIRFDALETRVKNTADSPVEPAGTASFGSELANAISSVDQLQVTGDQQAERVALGGGNLHETALALEKADVAMHLMMKVRNKIVDTYQEVMRMSV